MRDTQFIEGLNFKAPHPKAPDFVKAQGGMRREALIAWLQQQQGEWVNFDVKESKGGKWYAAVNDYKRDERAPSKPVNTASERDLSGTVADDEIHDALTDGGFTDDDIPF